MRNQEEINKVTTNFYRDLLKNKKGTKEFSERKLSKTIENIKDKITEESKLKSPKPLTIGEIKEITKVLKKKLLGLNGITAEFFRRLSI